MIIPFDRLVREYKVKPNGVLHIGAHLAEEAGDYERHKIENVIWVECHPEAIEMLGQILKDKPRHRLFPVAIADRDDLSVKFYKTSNRMSSSLLPLYKHIEKHPDVTSSGTVTVKTLTVDTLFRRNGLSFEDYNFLNMDIQGGELIALHGAEEYLKKCKWIYTEINTEELYMGCALLKDLNKFLEDKGFKLIEKQMSSDFNAWGDALYSRE